MAKRSGFLIGAFMAGALAGGCGATTDVRSPVAPGSLDSPGSSTPAPPSPAPGTSGTCSASQARWAVGQQASDDLLERARVAAHAQSARLVGPNEQITLEYSGARLNLHLNDRRVVRSVNCG
jgi:hypothetical protein